VPDRRRHRHEETRAEIITAPWDLAQRDGLAALSLRDVARVVAMRAPSLYNYFASKHAIYDATFRPGLRRAAGARTWRDARGR
jgi:AcrR family transcriptional regulator